MSCDPEPLRLAQRVAAIEPFWVMECAKTADRIARSPACDPARGGTPMIYLNIGEPDFTAPLRVQAAAKRCIEAGRTQYTQATGHPALREAIAGWYRSRWNLSVDPARIVVTAGASAALQLLTLALVEPGDEFLMPDPCYPCNRHFVTAAGGRSRLLPMRCGRTFPAGCGLGDVGLGRDHTRGDAGVAVQPHRHFGALRRDGAHRGGGAPAWWREHRR
jgi:aspartate/methionine/tyrosine aminotransferase